MNNWFPSEDNYNPNISKEQWIELIEDNNIFNQNVLVTFACIKKAEIATCSDMSREFGRTKNFYNTNVWMTGKKIYQKTNCNILTNDNEYNKFWPICCLGRDLDNGRFEYKIRPELMAAFNETKVLEDIDIMDDIFRFKSLLEYFIAHLDWLQNKNKNFIGYNKYIKPLFDKEIFTQDSYNGYSCGQGWKGNKIQNLIKEWDNYNGEKIYINVYASNIRSKGTYLNWENSWNNIRPEWNNSTICSLYITEEEFINAKSELKHTINELGLYTDNITNELKSFYTKYMSYINKNQATMNNNKYDNYINLLEKNHNLILTGAPGTGKTYLAKKIAEEMGCSEDEIGFVQFHPSYDYTDFVEGLRPKKDENGNIGFERKNGVFKEFCRKAIEANKTNIVDNFDESWGKLIDFLENNGFIDVPLLSGKGNIRIELNEYGTGLANRTYLDNNVNSDWIKGRSKFFSKEQLYRIYKGLNGTPGGGHDNYRKAIVNHMKNHFDLLDYIEGKPIEISSQKPFVFIIDEINRGEISKIFGELFYCIDPGYRGEKGKIKTQYQNLVEDNDIFYEGFYIPENVYIIGTMNDIDRSVESMDFAFRRRFAFAEIKANENIDMLNVLNNNIRQTAINKMVSLNNAISKTEGLSPAYHIGASYFLKLNDYDGDFNLLWEYHLEGLLHEYVRGMHNVEKIIEKLKNSFFNEQAENN